VHVRRVREGVRRDREWALPLLPPRAVGLQGQTPLYSDRYCVL